MPARTIAEARSALELAPVVSDDQARRYREALEEAEHTATAAAVERIEAIETEVRETRDEALRELTAVRDAFDDLSAEGATGRIPSGEYAHRLDDLAHRQVAAEERLRAAEEKVGLIEEIEADPIAWADAHLYRFASTRPEFPW